MSSSTPQNPAEIRIAMWSGPRNISTALMRSWGSRGDAAVTDEPLYAHYLATTDAPHPLREEVIASQSTDWREVVRQLTRGPIPGGRPIWYQKHMSQHLLPEMTFEVEGDDGRPFDWLDALTHVFLIRDPREVLLSFHRVVADPSPEDLGFPQQLRLFDELLERRGTPPPVIDARDVLRNPPAMLRRLCAVVGAPYDEAMLRWEPGTRDTDGVWADAWYGNVEGSTGFAPWSPREGEVPPHLRATYEVCRRCYDRLAEHRLRG